MLFLSGNGHLLLSSCQCWVVESVQFILELGLRYAVAIVPSMMAWSSVSFLSGYCYLCLCLVWGRGFLRMPTLLLAFSTVCAFSIKRVSSHACSSFSGKLTLLVTQCEAHGGHLAGGCCFSLDQLQQSFALYQSKSLCSDVFPPFQMVFAFTPLSATINLVISAYR